MKTQTIVTEITLDDLVNLISTASYGCNWMDFCVPVKSGAQVERVVGEAREDRLARVLLAGCPIFFCDYYAEGKDDFYGELRHSWAANCMMYEITLEDIKEGIARALNNGGYIRDYINHWADDECMNFDSTEAVAVMQWIVFGEEIYG